MAKRKFSQKAADEDCDIVIVGVGGQGLITLLKIIGEAATIEGKDLATSELHGLSQRGGSVEVHIRFGKEIYSPLVKQGGADLIISLEAQESLKSCYYGSKESKTIFLVNDFFSPIEGIKKQFSSQKILKNLQEFSEKAILVPANKICQEAFQNPVFAGIFLLGYASFQNFIPLKPSSYLKAIEKTVPEKFVELNKKVFHLAQNRKYAR